MTAETPPRPPDDDAFADLLSALPPAAATPVRAAMAEPWRRYHAAWHLGRMWRLHQAHGPRDWDADLALAIAFHDIVYRPQAARHDNEYQSAATLLANAAPLALPPARAARIATWIIASADHLGQGAALVPVSDEAGAWFLDLDLEPLASDDFAANTALIRQEFAHVPDAGFSVGRRAFLESVAAAPRLFRTRTADRLGWEEAARRNIAADLRDEPGGSCPGPVEGT
ncbi:HD domain-containing protein [Muricoccus radiodurans]|uniref:HD domain-containing protein n=1 Tax=Muricoccus radiodurans TaxID=2231721 RepID=UPI003CF7E546